MAKVHLDGAIGGFRPPLCNSCCFLSNFREDELEEFRGKFPVKSGSIQHSAGIRNNQALSHVICRISGVAKNLLTATW